jgi:hypothetical protein
MQGTFTAHIRHDTSLVALAYVRSCIAGAVLQGVMVTAGLLTSICKGVCKAECTVSFNGTLLGVLLGVQYFMVSR